MQQRVLTVYLDAVPECLDGLKTESFAQWTLVYNLADRLLEFGANGEITGNLAEDWQQIPGKQKSWRFRLSPNRIFHDGSPVTAEDIVSSILLAITTPNTYGSTSNLFSPNGIVKESNESIILTATQSGASALEQLNMNAFAIRKQHAEVPVYSGPYRVITREQESITLEAVSQHPAIESLSYRTIIIKKLSTAAADNAEHLNENDTIILSRNGFLFHQQKLPATAKMFPFAAGNSHILSLRPKTPSIEWIKASIHEVMYKKQILNAASHARPMNSFFPPGFVVNAPVIPAPAQRPASVIKLNIGAPLGIKGTGILEALKHELIAYDIDINWLIEDSWKMLDDDDELDLRDGFIAACHLDNQDPVRLAKHYFTGPRRAIWQLPSFIEGLLDKAAALPSGLERDRMIRNFFKAVVTETPCIPLFFCPMVVWATGDVDLSHQEFYGNTFKFAKVRIGESLVLNQEQMNLSLRMFAHDFKRPFSLIKTAGQLIEAATSIEDIRRISERLLPQMTNAMSSVDGMIRELLQLKSDAEQSCNLLLALRNAVDQAAASYGKQDHPIEFTYDDASTLVKGDQVHVERIFANLIHNALESAPEEARVWVHVANASSQEKEHVTITIGNEGTYIEPDVRSKLFDTGFSQKGRGRGLGLSIVQSLVETSGGSITVDSNPATGTEFQVMLILLPKDNMSLEVKTKKVRQRDAGHPQGLKLVLVEDDPFLREAWEMTWGTGNFQSFECPNSLKVALEQGLLSIGQDTIVVTDYLFDQSDLTGADVVDIARIHSAFKVLLASDYIDLNLSSKVDGSIGKIPIGPDELLSLVAGQAKNSPSG